MIDLHRFPEQPGVYLMKDAAGKILYIGKAKKLRSRLKQYFAPGGDGRAMVPFLTSQVTSIDTIVVLTEEESLLLENRLIKTHQPKFNALLKDDKSFISLMINHKDPWPRLQLIRYKGRPKKEGLYFGPYTNAEAARKTLELLGSLFPLRQCSDDELKRRTRPCLLHGIGRCVAPCMKLCSHEEYDQFVQGAIAFLQGEDRSILKRLKLQMEAASDALEFEKAEHLLQTIRHLEYVADSKKRRLFTGKDASDLIGLYREADDVMVVRLLFREGILVGSDHDFFKQVAQEDAELLSSYLLQKYTHAEELPKKIITSLKLPESLGPLLQIKIQLAKKAMRELGTKNAESLFKQQRKETDLREKRLLDLQELFRLNNYPRRIECFDTSNLSGTTPVAALISFHEGVYDKKRTRLFKVKSGNDYDAMREQLLRRLERGKKEDDLPDLIILDGGKGQLQIGIDLLKSLDIVTIDLIALAKESSRHDKGLSQEKIFLSDQKEPILLGRDSPLLFLLQRIRDEAHRVAIGFHRKKRAKALISSSLESISGIGPKKRAALLRHFGSVKRIQEASDEELSAVVKLSDEEIRKLRLL